MTSRSLGDKYAHGLGVSCKPIITVREIKKNDEFIVLGSDGLWEFIENKQVIKILVGYRNNLEKCAYKLYKTSCNLWKK